MKIIDLPTDIIKNIITKVEDFQDFTVYTNCYMAFYKYFDFDTSVVKQKVLEVEYETKENISHKNSLFIFNGYCIHNNNSKLEFLEYLYYNKEIIGFNWFVDRNKTEIMYTIFIDSYGTGNNRVLLYFTNNEISSKYEDYINQYDILETKTVPIRKDKPKINKKRYILDSNIRRNDITDEQYNSNLSNQSNQSNNSIKTYINNYYYLTYEE